MISSSRRRRSLVRAFVDEAIAGRTEAAAELARAELAAGTSVITLTTDLLDTAQRYVGELWQRGDATSADELRVASAIGRVIEELDAGRADGGEDGAAACLLLTLPGEEHSLGIRLVRQALIADGWRASLCTEVPMPDLVARLDGSSWRLVAVSSTYPERPTRGQLQALAAEVRRRRIPLLAGGRALEGPSELARAAGFDSLASDARMAVIEARRLIRVSRPAHPGRRLGAG